MGISTQYEYSQWTSHIDQAQQNVFQLGQQISTGKSLNQMSDNPLNGLQVLDMNSIQATLSQYNSNIQAVTSRVNLSTNSLSSAQTLVQQAYTLALQGANSTLDANSISGIVSQISQIQKQLMSLGNTQGSNGQYLFGGQVTNTPPFSIDGSGNLAYNGDTNAVYTAAGPNLSVQSNTVGKGLFDTVYNQLNQLKTDLQSGNPSTVSNVDVASLQTSLSDFQQAEGAAGAVSQTLTSATTANTQRLNDLTSSISNLQDANMAQVISKYTQAQSAYQAALLMVSNGSKVSLINYL